MICHTLLNKSSLFCILLLYILTRMHNDAQDLQSNNTIELYQNNDSYLCLFSNEDVYTYLIIGRVTINSDHRSVGFQKRTVNSKSFEYACMIHFSNSCHDSQSRDCYCTSTNESNVYDIVWNKTLKKEDSDGKVRAVVLVLDKEKIFSNEVNLPSPYNPAVDKDNFQLEINDQPVNTEKCLQTITRDTLKLQYKYNVTFSKGFPVTISILDDDTITELNNSFVEMYILREFKSKDETNTIFKVNVCNRDFLNINCTFKNAIHTSYNEVRMIIISVVVGVAVTIAGASLFVVMNKIITKKHKFKRWTKRKRLHGKVRESMIFQEESLVPAKGENIKLKPTGLLNIFKEYHGSELNDEALKKVSLLLIGKHGNGKSATGNTILGRKEFTSTANPTESEQVIKKETTTIDDRLIHVVEGPSISGNVQSDLKNMTELFQKTLALVPEGYDTVLLIFRYGSRYTSEDYQNLFFLKLILGEHFVSNHCIIVITGGDNFEHETEEDTILSWCMKTDGPFRKLVKECQNRVVLFDNKTMDEAKRRDQVKHLLYMIDKLRTYQCRYINID